MCIGLIVKSQALACVCAASTYFVPVLLVCESTWRHSKASRFSLKCSNDFPCRTTASIVRVVYNFWLSTPNTSWTVPERRVQRGSELGPLQQGRSGRVCYSGLSSANFRGIYSCSWVNNYRCLIPSSSCDDIPKRPALIKTNCSLKQGLYILTKCKILSHPATFRKPVLRFLAICRPQEIISLVS